MTLSIIALCFGLVVAIGAGLLQFRQIQSRENLEIGDEQARGGVVLHRRVGRANGAILVAYNCALFGSMVAGILAKYFWERGFAGAVDLNAMWKPILITPIIFLPVYVATTKQPRGLIPVLLAFQNGFFWQTVFESGAPPLATGV